MYNRNLYLKEIIKFKDTEFIKVITGIRRSGKSYLLKNYHNHLIKEQIPTKNICYLNFEDYDNIELTNDKELYKYLKNNFSTTEKIYFLFDEIQFVENWQKVVNSLRVSFNADIIITGSNAKMLSSELATYLSGRFVEIKIYPLSFKEFLEFKNYDGDFRQINNLYKEYKQYGGFPAVVLANEELKNTILQGIYDTVLLNDVAFRSGIKEPQILKNIVKFLSSNIGQTTNPNVLKNTLKSNNIKISNQTILRYLSMLNDAFMFYETQKYDIRGKEYLQSKGKYFICDLGLKRAILNKQDKLGSELENLVFLELIRKGYVVDIGSFDNKEIDFIAKKENKIIYIQVALELPESSTRETDNLLKIKDNYEKILITESLPNNTDINGIKHIHIIDWLLNE